MKYFITPLLMIIAPFLIQCSDPNEALRLETKVFLDTNIDQSDFTERGVFISHRNELTPINNSAEEETFTPASVVKLITTAMALEQLGKDFQFTSTFLWRHTKHKKIITDFTYQSALDPTFGHPIFDRKNKKLKSVAKHLRELGVRKIYGDLNLQEPIYWQRSMHLKKQFNYADRLGCYSVEAQPFLYHEGCATLVINGLNKAYWATSYVKTPLRFRMKAGKRINLKIDPKVDEFLDLTYFRLYGTWLKKEEPQPEPPKEDPEQPQNPAPAPAPAPTEPQPATLVQLNNASFLNADNTAAPSNKAHTPILLNTKNPRLIYKLPISNTKKWFKKAWHSVNRNNGLSWYPKRELKSEDTFNELTTFSVQSPKALELLTLQNKHSINYLADTFFKYLEQQWAEERNTPSDSSNTWFKHQLNVWSQELGNTQLPEKIKIYEGSGLSKENRITASGLLQLLSLFKTKPYFNELLQTLPISGKDGTLAGRLYKKHLRGRIYAKTGTLSGFYQLAGYLPKLNEKEEVIDYIAFVVLTKTKPNRQGRARRLQDSIVEELFYKANPHLKL